jgi:hypothetical protein
MDFLDLSILIVSYNTRELTLECLRSVFDQTRGIKFEVIVVDNASTDGSPDAIASRFPQARLTRLERNIGFAAGNNLAAGTAGGRRLLLLNPDTVILDAAVNRVMEFADAHPSAGIVGGRTFYGDGSLNYTSCHGRPTVWSLLCMGFGLSSIFRRSRLFNPESLGSWKRDTVREVDVVTGCFLLIDRDLWQRLGGFDESFFMYGEETDLCLRAWDLGSRCMICPEAKLIHHGGRSERARADKLVKTFRAKVQLLQKHWRRGTPWFGCTMLRLWALNRMAILSLARHLRPDCQEGYEAWRAVWRRRGEWAG